MKTLVQIMDKIDFQEDIVKKVIEAAQNLNIDSYIDAILKLTNIESASEAWNKLKKELEPDPGNFKMLTCMLYSLNFTHEEYKKRKISEKIFIDTMKAFKRFIDERYAGSKEWAFDRDWWTYRQTAMSIFRIGELEYEMKKTEEKNYISIHIPSDANLKFEKVIESMNESIIFFKKYYPEFQDVEYVCRSWLLSSDLEKVLPATSNILKFRSLFNIISENYNSSGFIKWIYKSEFSDLNDLPEDTTLQRNLKQYLLAGNSVSVAYGIIDFNRINLQLL